MVVKLLKQSRNTGRPPHCPSLVLLEITNVYFSLINKMFTGLGSEAELITGTTIISVFISV